MDSTELLLPAKQSQVANGLRYRCACGTEYPISAEEGGRCPDCQKWVRPEALKSALNATVSINGLEEHSQISHFDIGDSESDQLRHLTYGHFQLDRLLGTGGMGAVYRALDTSLQRYVAVKVMKQPDKNMDSRVASMLREAVAQARLNHPNVVTIYYVGRQQEEPFLAMELLPGPTLAEVLRETQSTINYADVIRYGIQVCSALHHASQFGIIHGDIKPGNLLLTNDCNIKLSDFGLSSSSDGKVCSGSVSGTPAYFAPELLEDEVSIQSDMYALGVTLFELVFGRTPFKLQGTSVRERLQTHRTAIIEFPENWPKDVPREFADVISKLLAKRPEDRYPDYEALIVDLKSVEPVSKTPAGMAPRAMAYLTDQIFLLMCLLPFATVVLLLTRTHQLEPFIWLVPIVAFMSLIVPAIYLIFMYHGWRSLGRYLFQLRIVDQLGLPPRPQQVVTREVFRNALSWIGPLAIYVSLFYQEVGLWPIGLLIPFLLADGALVFFRSDRQALHDYLSKSHVVLETNEDSRNHPLY